MKKATLAIIVKDNKILLAMKKRWFWKWKYNWPWWKVEKWETIYQAMIREAFEELKIKITDQELIWQINFYFKDHPKWNLEWYIFYVNNFEWDPQETEEMIISQIKEKFSCSIDEMLSQTGLNKELDKQLELTKAQNKLEKLLKERDNMGPVNLRADIEAQELMAQIDILSKEREDLISAISKLRQAISKINKEARERLLKAFGTVNKHFQDLFGRLFNGGSAYLELTDEDDPLEAGLEIYAQPPGKKMQILSLFSGGEQTLTSIALIFAMFLTNPAPICVLDEIDAPLDDSNVDRVCSLLEQLTKETSTRFIIITHHRMTMARVDRLYGVTMGEKGISQLVSVDLQQPSLLDNLAA